MQLLTSALALASGENDFCPVKHGSYTPLLRLPQGLQNTPDIDRWVSVLRSNMRHADRCVRRGLGRGDAASGRLRRHVSGHS